MSNAPTRLRLHSVEHYMWADSRRLHPLTFFLRLEIAEQLDPRRLRAAIDHCSGYHPLLTAAIARHHGRWVWQLPGHTPGLTTHAWNHYAQARDDWTIDPTRESGVRFSLASGPVDSAESSAGAGSSKSELWLQVHHSCSDARGILNFLRDVQAAYQRPPSPQVMHQRQCAAQQNLANRAVGFSPSLAPYVNLGGPKWNRIWKYFSHRSRPLARSLPPPAPPSAAPQEFSPAHVSRQLVFQADTWRQQRDTGAAPVTLNDCLLQGVFHSLAVHQARAAAQAGDPWIRIGVPIDMRQFPNRPPFACNCSSLVFLDRRLQRILHQPDLLIDIHREMQHVKRHALGNVFFDCLALAHSLPLAMRLAVNDQRCAVSAVASNLGAVEFPVVDGFTITSIDFLPPLRPGTAVAVGMSTYAGYLRLSLHYDQRLISCEDANALVDRLAGHMTDIPRR